MRSRFATRTPRYPVFPLAFFCWLIFASSASLGKVSQHCSEALGKAQIAQGEAFSGDLEILSWNIQKASNDGWANDLAALAGEVNLAFIQEASVQAGLSEAINSPLYQTFAAGYADSTQQTGVMTLSTTSPSGECSLTSWEPWLGTPKATSVTEYPLAGREDRLLTINLHAVNFALGLQDLRQQLRALSELLEHHQGPMILAGDLNTWSGQRQTVVDDFTSKFGLNAIAFSPDLRTKVFGRALDHIYIRGLEAQSAQVIPVTSSDHNPLRVRLAFN
ncbi:MAG: endonuclease/exonuclease/phosphatase family protein [Halioglobus sp.]|nr:endonuclease/exonuclease/phosphatase family protein [Halioglobus sp.]